MELYDEIRKRYEEKYEKVKTGNIFADPSFCINWL